MSTDVQTAEQKAEPFSGKPVVNDFQIVVATVNGTGSQTANTSLIRALFTMGIPVNGKNIFPSNIQGLPTWFSIRLNKDGYVARRENHEIIVAMNQATVFEDIQNVASGGICLYPEEWGIREERDDIIYYAMPIKATVDQFDVPRSLTDYVANMVYVGVLAYLIGIELDEIHNALKFHFGGKEKPIKMNMDVVEAAYEWASAELVIQHPYQAERMNGTEGLIMLDGNSAAALGAVFGGVTFAAWYPITPSTSMIDALRDYATDLRHDPDTGNATYAVVQAEDELAAIGMVLGAGWAGARALTATSGPGMSLMSEFAGMAFFAEIPSVIWNIQRVGPSTGLPTRTSQGDLMAAYFLGHGDSRHPVLLPANLKEAFEFGWRAHDIADQLQTLILVLSDLDLGMNLWMSEPFDYPDEPINRGKVLDAEGLDKVENWGRYVDTDGDGIPYRTLPGTDHPRAAYFTRGTGHNEMAIYSERPEDWTENFERLNRKFNTARDIVPQPVIQNTRSADFGIIAYGTVDPAILEAIDRLKDQKVKASYLRLRALPVNGATRKFIEKHDRVYVVENNADGQLARIVHMEYPELATKVISVAHLDGFPFSARQVVESIMEKEGRA